MKPFQMSNEELARTLETLLKGCARKDFLAYECGTMQAVEACTVGYFGDWMVGSESDHPGGNYRDDDTGDDKHHAHFMAIVKNHGPLIIAALRAGADAEKWRIAVDHKLIPEDVQQKISFAFGNRPLEAA